MEKQQIGVIGLAVMGKNIALNIENRGYTVAVYNRTTQKTIDFINQEGSEKNFAAAETIKKFVRKLEKPRKILLMVKAGAATDATISSLLPYLEKEDIIIDGGNTLYENTIRRSEQLQEKGIHFIGMGISGGEEGALKGPSMMPGGPKEAYNIVAPMLESISAKVNEEPCVTYIGPDGAGHFVKMIHNGIEYGDMQLISEAYFVLKHILGLNNEELHEVFAEWNDGELDSYLIDITAKIFTKKDNETGEDLVDVILDKAGQKGTGKWTSMNALDLGVPLPSITESVFARFLSSMKEERTQASEVFNGPEVKLQEDNYKEVIEKVRKALYMGKICSYAQGFSQMRAASEKYNWGLDYGEVAMIWRGGSIVRAGFLQDIKDAYSQNPYLSNLLLDSYFKYTVENYQYALREVVSMAVKHGIAVPAFSSTIAYFDSYRSQDSSANLIQAQRDYFGAHTYERKDKEGTFHSNWN